LDEGSEHLVFLDAPNATVYKATRIGIFGESYYIDSRGIINQKNCSPLEYLTRLRLWKKLFQSAPRDMGMTEQGQIISSQQFISGKKPTQDSVDSFLIQAGLSAVKQKYWLWKKAYPEFEIWLGDARDDNFVETDVGIVPIDIRLWFSGYSPTKESGDW
jgi:Serine/Threonine/Tyrosine Kinase found in polyvalent proteins